MTNLDSYKKIEMFRDLHVWKEGHDLVLHVYRFTKEFPKEEGYGLVSEMRRCAVSVTSNIAEGLSRKTYKEKSRFYYIAKGSLVELHNQLIVSYDEGYLSPEVFREVEIKLGRVHRILNAFIFKTETFTK